ncbi:hypothetical protein [Sphingobacterium sp. MYb382]|uniref:hypothetical protein n=1 Tax=Sphingobacterium sp. MYb382 TaxID=2745278 RepID=UPI0030B33C45
MKTKTTFTLDNKNLTNGFQRIFDWIQESKLSVTSPKGKEYIKMPFVFALVIAIVFPFITVAAVILSLSNIIKISIEREVQVNEIKELSAHID